MMESSPQRARRLLPAGISYEKIINHWQQKLQSGYLPTTHAELMLLVSVMPVENPQAIPEPLVRAKILLEGMAHTPEINTLYETVLEIQRPLAPTQSLQEMGKAAAQQTRVGL